MKNLKYYFKKAEKEKFAIPQFNFSDFTQLKGIVAVAKKMNSPVILGTSEGEGKFFGLDEAVALRNLLRNKLRIPIFLNLDHGKSFEAIKGAIDAGYDMVHFDGSKLSLQENIKETRKVVKYAKSFWGKNVLVEGEVGKIGTDSSKIYAEKFEIKEEYLTKPEQAKEFSEKTIVDVLAISIGTFHGIDSTGENPKLRLDILEKNKREIGSLPLVLHGGSGIPEEDIKGSIQKGIAKININTELRMAFSNNLRKALEVNLKEITPYKFLPMAQDSVEKVVEQKINLFGSGNKV